MSAATLPEHPPPHFHRFRFLNGILDTRTATFTPFRDGNADVRCINAVDEDFDPDWCTAPL
jgi:hypothetical protein